MLAGGSLGAPLKVVFSLALLATMTSAVAHHASAPHFDATRPITLEGVVTKFDFVNPHAYLYLDVADADGNVTNWNCEMNSSTPLRRQGWTEDLFRPGMSIRVDGIAARRDPHGCSFESGTLANGTRIARSGTIESGTEGSSPGLAAVANHVTTNGSPTLIGTWITAPPRNNGAAGGGPPGMERFAGLLTEAGQAAAESYDERFDDPALSCSPSSIIRAWSEPNGVSEIARTDDVVTIKHEFMDTVRSVDLAAREHPATLEPSLTGHSVGWIEDGTLVIETVGFAAGVLLPHPGIMHTEDMRVLERISLSDDGAELTRDYEITDPGYLNSPLTGTNRWVRTELALSPYGCTELSGINNVRPTGQ